MNFKYAIWVGVISLILPIIVYGKPDSLHDRLCAAISAATFNITDFSSADIEKADLESRALYWILAATSELKQSPEYGINRDFIKPMLLKIPIEAFLVGVVFYLKEDDEYGDLCWGMALQAKNITDSDRQLIKDTLKHVDSKLRNYWYKLLMERGHYFDSIGSLYDLDIESGTEKLVNQAAEGSFLAQSTLGRILYLKGDYEQACAFLEAASQYNPKVLYMLGGCYSELAQSEQAEAALLKAISCGNNNAYVSLGLHYISTEDYDAASKAAVDGIKLGINDCYFINVILMYKEKKFAYNEILKALDAIPVNAQNQYLYNLIKADLLYDNGLYDQAELYSIRAGEAFPASMNPIISQIQALIKLKNVKKAMAALEFGYKNFPTRTQAEQLDTLKKEIETIDSK